MHSGFGDTVHVHELRSLVAMPVKPRFQAAHHQGFAGEDDTAERQITTHPQALLGEHELLERGWSLGQHGHSFPHE
jgi:hypothetical protein